MYLFCWNGSSIHRVSKAEVVGGGWGALRECSMYWFGKRTVSTYNEPDK